MHLDGGNFPHDFNLGTRASPAAKRLSPTGQMHKIPRVYRGPNGFTGKMTPGDVYLSFCPEFDVAVSAQEAPRETSVPAKPR